MQASPVGYADNSTYLGTRGTLQNSACINPRSSFSIRYRYRNCWSTLSRLTANASSVALAKHLLSHLNVSEAVESCKRFRRMQDAPLATISRCFLCSSDRTQLTFLRQLKHLPVPATFGSSRRPGNSCLKICRAAYCPKARRQMAQSHWQSERDSLQADAAK